MHPEVWTSIASSLPCCHSTFHIFPFVFRPGSPAEEVPQEARVTSEIFWAVHGVIAIGQGEAPAQTIKAWRICRVFFSAGLDSELRACAGEGQIPEGPRAVTRLDARK